MAEILGPRELTRDIGTRLHKFRGNLDAEFNHYHPRGKQIVEAYVRGVNAYVDEAMRTPASLPLEFKMLGITPGRWTPEVVISRHQALTSNVQNEATLTRALGALGNADKLRDLLWLQGGDPTLTLDPLINPETFPANVLKVYNAFRDSIDFRPDDVAPAYRGQARGAVAAADAPPVMAHATHGSRVVDTDIGSNNWVVSGARTRAGGPSWPTTRTVPRGAVAALHRAPRGAGLERDRRRRAGAARHLDRPQRAGACGLTIFGIDRKTCMSTR